MFKPTPNISFPDMTPASGALTCAFFVALSHLALLLAIQVENYLFYLWPATHSFAALPFFLVNLGFAQWENIVVAALLGALTLLTASHRPGRWFSFAAVTLANLYLVLDQIGFKLFFDHFHPSMLEGAHRLSDLLSSVTAELDAAFFINILLFVLITAVLASLLLRATTPRAFRLPARVGGLHRSPKALSLLSILLVVEALFPVRADYVKLYHHPFHNLLAALDSPPPPIASATTPPAVKSDEPLNLQRLRYGTVMPDPAGDARLDTLLQQSQAHKPRWNIVWIVMESVGSKQLLNADDLPDPIITPTLSRLAQHALLFNSMYSVFPGTVRSHVDMLTGGRTLTWGSVFKELSYPYEGPTLSRSLSAAGYDTALFSAQKLDFENMNGFYKRAGYDYYYDFGEADPEFQRQNTLQSWGAKEPPIVSLAVKWLDKRRDPSRPFFLQYLTVATHHPYTIPADYRGPAKGNTRKENYLNALNYSDAALGLLVAQLKSRHLLDNTLIVISGDHGEAFGDYHAQNLLHKNAIYEENIKNFLLIANPVLFPDTVLSQRLASIGDIMPTLLGMANVPPADVPGQNIMSKSYSPRLVYFYKNTNPELWGLRDGEWKFIGAGLGGNAQLFDLKTDPDESYNVADIYPDHAALYDELAARWYVETNHEFVSRLKDFHYPGGKELRATDLRTLGPKLLVFGYQQPEQRGSGEDFIEIPSFNPFEKVVAWSRWVSYPEDKVIHYVWTSPSGEAHDFDFTVQSGWSSTWVNGELPLPMEEGTWHLSLQDGKQTLLSGTFIVDGKAPLRIHRDTEARAQEYAVGKYITNEFGKEQFSSTAKLTPTDHIVMWTRWKQLDHKRRITYRWKAPSGQTTEFYFDVNEGWDQTWVNLGNDQPVEPGRWEVTLWDGEHRLGTAGFNVAPVGAP